MVNLNDIMTVFSFFFKMGMRAKRTRLFLIFAGAPVLIFLIIRIVMLLQPETGIRVAGLFVPIAGLFYFQLFIPLMALFYGSSVLNDEVENKTLVYLTTSPVSKGSVFAGKFVAQLSLSVFLTLSGLILSFFISNFSNLTRWDYWVKLGGFAGAALFSVIAYSGFFSFLGTIMKRSVLLGICFIFGWESWVHYVPGVTQKLTISHFVKSIMPERMTESGGFLFFNLAPTPVLESIVVLVAIAVVSIALAVAVFYNREYTLSEQA